MSCYRSYTYILIFHRAHPIINLNTYILFIVAQVAFSIDGVGAGVGVLGQIRLHHSSPFKRSIFNYPATRHWIALKCVRSREHGEIGKTYFFRAADPRMRDSEEICLHSFLGDVKLEITSIINLRPLKFAVVRQQDAADIVRSFDGNVLTAGAWTGDGSAGKFDPDASFTGAWVIIVFAKPDEIAGPICVRIPSNYDVIVDMIFVESLKGSVPIGKIAIPRVIIEWVYVTVGFRLVETREDYRNLASQDI